MALLRRARALLAGGTRIYYTLGNHDIAFTPSTPFAPTACSSTGGDWMTQGTYVAIDDGQVTLHRW
jgi:hypothetical protein